MATGSSSIPPTRPHFVVRVICKCGQVGSATWEENGQITPQGPRPMLVGISSGFYERVRKKDIGQTEVVCAVCEAVVPI
jgi:hypothetical protein